MTRLYRKFWFTADSILSYSQKIEKLAPKTTSEEDCIRINQDKHTEVMNQLLSFIHNAQVCGYEPSWEGNIIDVLQSRRPHSEAEEPR